jgi:hypothetical protein
VQSGIDVRGGKAHSLKTTMTNGHESRLLDGSMQGKNTCAVADKRVGCVTSGETRFSLLSFWSCL